MRFVAAPEFPVFPTRERPLSPYEAAVAGVAQTHPAVVAAAPDVVVHDILTLAPALSGEFESVPVATLIPHLYPPGEPGFPPFGSGPSCRAPGLAGGSGERSTVPSPPGCGAAPPSSTRPVNASGSVRATAPTTVSARSCAWSQRCPSWSIPGRGRRTSTSSAR